MTEINNLIRLAKFLPKPAELTVRSTSVNRLVEHMFAVGSQPHGWTRDMTREALLAGKVKLLDVPLRVIGLNPFHRS